MHEKTPHQKSCHLIACAVFSPALEVLCRTEPFSGLQISYLPSHLHAYPARLEKELQQIIPALQRRGEKIRLLYGTCFPGIDAFCAEYGLQKICGEHCYQMLLGDNHFEEILRQTAGTYFLEQDLIEHFEEYCLMPMELYDEEIRKMCFAHYRQLVYLRQPNDPDLEEKIQFISKLLRLPVKTVSIDYTNLAERLLKIL